MSPAPGHNLTATKKDLEPALKKIEKLLEERKGLSDDIREIKKDLKDKGYEPKMVNVVLKLRAMDSEKRREEEDLRDMYLSALGLC